MTISKNKKSLSKKKAINGINLSAEGCVLFDVKNSSCILMGRIPPLYIQCNASLSCPVFEQMRDEYFIDA